MEKVLIALLAVLLFILLVASITNCSWWSTYPKIYKTLPNRKFYRNHSQVYTHSLHEYDDGFVWFMEDNSFELTNGVYLFNSIVTYFDLYSLYWLIKYRRWFKNNVDVTKLDKW